jgi:maleylpyruvate isomerase
MGRKAECPTLRLVDGDDTWAVGDGPAVVVTGPAPELAAWLMGRSKGKPLRADGSRKLPPLPAWL